LQFTKKIKILHWKDLFEIIQRTFVEFFKENSFLHGAALSYYTVFALVPIIYLGVITFGQIIGQETMIDIVSNTLKEQIGIEDISGITTFLTKIQFGKGSLVLNMVGLVVLLFTSTALLTSLKNSLNTFFNIKPKIESKKKLFLSNILSRFISVGMLALLGLIVIITYFAETVLLSLGKSMFQEFSNFQWYFFVFIQHGVSIFTNIIIFCFVFKYLHDGKVPWKLAWTGSFVTSILLYLGQLLIKYYLVNYFFAKDGGFAGTLLIILAWMYYSSQIIFLGAKFTEVYGRKIGNPIH
jgi:membrane protein